jgi:glutathione peroxidase-family protein
MTDLYQLELKRLDGEATTLSEYAGKTLLIVNVASRCGLTPQYRGLEALYRKYRPKGPDIEWNFAKFLVGKDGELIARYDPRTAPSELAAEIERALS